MSKTEFKQENDLTISINNESYNIPFAVYQLIIKTSEERDMYKILSKEWIEAKEESMPKVGLNVEVLTNDLCIKIAHCSNSNSWYDEKSTIEYGVIMWRHIK